ncbi:hypothetical protein FHR33_001061 [Nonomuraea dietziae]|uniref:Uncharacterized protein n=1 Tax=Nonomuraea dietziae TaxID=65515 RepID=A0A7W5V071_9ACTN|nr:hypothetical protein [Nonomuraea dietziae]
MCQKKGRTTVTAEAIRETTGRLMPWLYATC